MSSLSFFTHESIVSGRRTGFIEREANNVASNVSSFEISYAIFKWSLTVEYETNLVELIKLDWLI